MISHGFCWAIQEKITEKEKKMRKKPKASTTEQNGFKKWMRTFKDIAFSPTSLPPSGNTTILTADDLPLASWSLASSRGVGFEQC